MNRQSSVVRPTVLFMVVLGLVPLLGAPASQGQTTSITSSGLNTKVTLGSVDPAGRQNYDITGGTRPGNGGNLFHSFGDFSVGTNNVARFGNDSGLATTNILSRVTGGNPSNIFGEINTANFPGANLYLINPAGVVFGSTATLNVGGSVKVSTADYLRLADGLRFNAVPGPQDALLSSSPVAAFGFLNAAPGTISVQGATLNTHEQDPAAREPHRALSLVGGDISLAGASLKAPGGIDLVSVASRGEVHTGAAGGITPPTLGAVRMVNSEVLTGDSSIPNSSSGPIVIRGGQLVMDRSTISASIDPAAAFQTFGAGHITLQLSDTIRANDSHIVSNGGGFNQGTISLEAGQAIRLTKSAVESDNVFGDPGGPAGRVALSAPVINLDESHVSATGHTTCCGASGGGSIAIQANQFQMKNGSELTTAGAVSPGGGNIVINATESVSLDHSRIDVSGGGDASPFGNPGGNAGNISITAGEAVRLKHAEILAEGAPSGPRAPGNGGNIVIDAGESFVSQASTLSAHSDNLTGGNIMIQSLEQLRLEGGLVSTAGGHGGAVTMQAGQFVLDNARVAANGVEGGGKISIDATDSVVLRNSPVALDVSGSNPIPIPAPGGEVKILTSQFLMHEAGINARGVLANGGLVQISTEETARLGGSRIDAGTGGGGGRFAGGIGIVANDSVSLLNGTMLSADNGGIGNGGVIGVLGNQVIMHDAGISVRGDFGNGGLVRISANETAHLERSRIDAGTAAVGGGGGGNAGDISILGYNSFVSRASIVSAGSGNGNGGFITVETAGNTVIDGGRLTTEATGGQSGTIFLYANDSVRLVNGAALSVDNSRAGNAGTISILLENGNFLADASSMTAEAREGQPGEIRISAREAVRLLNGSRITVNNNGVGPAGILTVEAGTSVVGENSTFVAQTGEGHGGTIQITAPDRVRLTNSIVSTGVGGSPASAGGTIEITSETVRLENGRVVSNASNGSGGAITIKTNDFRPDAASVVEALSLGGGGADGTVSIQPLP